MSDADEVPEDRGFKALFATYPQAAFETFVPEIIAERGQPVSIVVLGQEVDLTELGVPDRFLDVALLATWADGRQILLVEHWSVIRHIDWPRINLYVAHLLVRHPKADVLPVLLVTDPAATEVPSRWQMPAQGPAVLTPAVRLVRPTEADVPRLLGLRNRVAAALLALAVRGRVKAAVTAVRAFAGSPGTVDDLKRFLPFLESLATLTSAERTEYRRRLIEDPTMPLTVIEELMAEKRAEGEIAAILDLVRKRRLPVEAARAEIADLLAAGTITKAQADAANAKLGH